MKKLFLLFVPLLVISLDIRAQQDVQFSQYMLNPIYYNPASAGLDGTTNISAIHRSQWVGYSSSFDGNGGAPSSQLLSFSTPFSFKKLPLGLGFDFVHDKLGEVRSLNVGFTAAFHKELNKGRLSIGIKPGFVSKTLDFSKFRFNDPGDPLDIGTKESQIAPDLAVGLFYTRSNYSIGLGVSHLLSPSFNFGIDTDNVNFDNKLEKTFNISGSYTYEIAYNIVLSPSILIKSDLRTYSFDLSGIMTYNDKIWAGLSYRQQEAVVLILGYSFMKDNIMKVGYAFDYVVDEQKAKQPTSHEFFVKYTLPALATGNKKIIRTPRFRF